MSRSKRFKGEHKGAAQPAPIMRLCRYTASAIAGFLKPVELHCLVRCSLQVYDMMHRHLEAHGTFSEMDSWSPMFGTLF